MVPPVNRMATRARRRACLLLVSAGLLLGLASPGVAQDEGGRVEVLEVSGILDRTVAGFIDATIRRAEEEGSSLVVLQLDVTAGVGVPMDRIAGPIAGSAVPIVVWVGPPGAKALGAGAVMAQAAHVLAMAPGAVMGVATPVDLADEADAQRAAADLRALAELRGRDPDFAQATATEGAAVAVSAAGLDGLIELPHGVQAGAVIEVDEAELAERGVADFAAVSLPEVLRELDGRQIRTAAGARLLAVDPEQTDIRFHNLGLLARVLHTAANPTLAYLLVMAGALALVFEVFQPGFGVAGITGAVLLALGVYGLAVLPVSWLAFAVLALGVLLLSIDLAIAGFGALTAAGSIGLSAGSLLLFTGPQLLRPPVWLVVLVVVSAVVFFVVVMTTVLRAQASPALAAPQELLGQVGVVRSVLNPEGHVFVAGALWRARGADEARVRTGTRVRVVDLEESGALRVEEITADQLEESAQS